MPAYNRGNYVKVEFAKGASSVGEWMWVRVSRCDEQKLPCVRQTRQRAAQRLRRQGRLSGLLRIVRWCSAKDIINMMPITDLSR
jgi:hypothetical protein